MKVNYLATAAIVLAAAGSSAGATTITFSGGQTTHQPGGVTTYVEQGFTFSNINISHDATHCHPADCMMLNSQAATTMALTNGGAFSVSQFVLDFQGEGGNGNDHGGGHDNDHGHANRNGGGHGGGGGHDNGHGNNGGGGGNTPSSFFVDAYFLDGSHTSYEFTEAMYSQQSFYTVLTGYLSSVTRLIFLGFNNANVRIDNIVAEAVVDDDDNNVPETPLPATGVLLVGALGAVSALRRRQKTQG